MLKIMEIIIHSLLIPGVAEYSYRPDNSMSVLSMMSFLLR